MLLRLHLPISNRQAWSSGQDRYLSCLNGHSLNHRSNDLECSEYVMKTQTNNRKTAQFENIKLGKFENNESYKEVSRGVVLATRVESCVITLNDFSITQLLEGAKVYVACPGDIVARIGLLMFLDEN